MFSKKKKGNVLSWKNIFLFTFICDEKSVENTHIISPVLFQDIKFHIFNKS